MFPEAFLAQSSYRFPPQWPNHISGEGAEPRPLPRNIPLLFLDNPPPLPSKTWIFQESLESIVAPTSPTDFLLAPWGCQGSLELQKCLQTILARV